MLQGVRIEITVQTEGELERVVKITVGRATVAYPLGADEKTLRPWPVI